MEPPCLPASAVVASPSNHQTSSTILSEAAENEAAGVEAARAFCDFFSRGAAEIAPSSEQSMASLIAREDVDGVPGVFLLRRVFSAEESAALANVVRLAHRGRAPRVESEKRRDSQHHRAVRVPQDAMSVICDRLRPHLPNVAGPRSNADLEAPGREISTFLRCYHYLAGDTTKPHFDRSFCYCEHTPNVLSSFSAYSVLLYVGDSCEGGATTFFQPDPTLPVSKSGLSPQCDLGRLQVAATVTPCTGDVLFFPHGKHPGCHPDPLHEGSTVLSGEKLLIRTDVIFCAPKTRKK